MKIGDIIIPHHDRHDHLKNCLDCFDNSQFNIIIVSGGSFAENCNKGAKIAETDNLIFLNDDTLPSKETLIKLAENNADFVGVYQEMQINGVWKKNTGIGYRLQNGMAVGFLPENPGEQHFPNGFCFKIKKSVWKKLGGFDEQFKNGCEDHDLAFRVIKNGYSIGYVEDYIKHFHSQSTGRLDRTVENRMLLEKKWNNKKIIKLLNLGEEKKLNILITNNHLDRYAGSETFTYTLNNELQRIGHNVDVFTLEKGEFAKKFNNIVDKPKSKYDLILINHNSCLEALKDVKGYKILTCHGTTPPLEQPRIGADKYVSISEEVQTHLKKLGFESEIIRNGIDCTRFNIKKPINKELKNVLSLAKTEFANNIIKQACDIMGLNFTALTGVFNIEDSINENDLVVTLGRGAYESMACGRAVVVFDARGYMGLIGRGDGIVNGNYAELGRCNFSGRSRNIQMNVNDLIEEFKKYNEKMGKDNRDYAVRKLNMRYQAQKYLEIYNNRNIVKQEETTSDKKFCFIDSSTTDYGIAKYMERALIKNGCQLDENGKTISYANDIGAICYDSEEPITPENHMPLKRACTSKADFIFYSQKVSQKWFDKDNCYYLPSGFDEDLFKNCNVNSNRDIDAGFVGRKAFARRINFINFLENNLKEKFVFKTGIYFQDLANFYNRCKIVPNWSTINDITMRSFEATASGALLITNRVPYLNELFEFGKEIIVVDNMQEMLEKIDYYLKFDNERKYIAENGQKRALRDHSYTARANKIKEVIWN